MTWPTPTAADAYTDKMKSAQQKGEGRHSLTLANAVKMWPTPLANSWKEPAQKKHGRGSGTLQDAVKAYPTPTGPSLCGGTKNYRHLKTLEAEGQITEEERRSMAAGNGGQLNPAWVEWLMGFPIGWTDLGASETP